MSGRSKTSCCRTRVCSHEATSPWHEHTKLHVSVRRRRCPAAPARALERRGSTADASLPSALATSAQHRRGVSSATEHRAPGGGFARAKGWFIGHSELQRSAAATELLRGLQESSTNERTFQAEGAELRIWHLRSKHQGGTDGRARHSAVRAVAEKTRSAGFVYSGGFLTCRSAGKTKAGDTHCGATPAISDKFGGS